MKILSEELNNGNEVVEWLAQFADNFNLDYNNVGYEEWNAEEQGEKGAFIYTWENGQWQEAGDTSSLL